MGASRSRNLELVARREPVGAIPTTTVIAPVAIRGLNCVVVESLQHIQPALQNPTPRLMNPGYDSIRSVNTVWPVPFSTTRASRSWSSRCSSLVSTPNTLSCAASASVKTAEVTARPSSVR
jgi:hypothetical protein